MSDLLGEARACREHDDHSACRVTLERAASLGSQEALALLDRWFELEPATKRIVASLVREPREPPGDDRVRRARVSLEDASDFNRGRDRSDPRVFRALEALLGSPSWNDRVEAIAFLELMTGEPPARALLSATRDPDGVVRRRARQALAGTRFARERLVPEVLAALEAGSREGDAWSRAQAVEGLGRFFARVLLQRADAALDDADPRVRASGLAAIAELVMKLDHEGAPVFGRAGSDSEPSVRARLVLMVRGFYANDLWKALEPLVADPDPGIALDARGIVDERRL